MNHHSPAPVQIPKTFQKRFRISYTLQKGNFDCGIQSFVLECEEITHDRVFQKLASLYARDAKEQNRITSQLKFSGMASIGKGRGIKNIGFVETATPLPFPD